MTTKTKKKTKKKIDFQKLRANDDGQCVIDGVPTDEDTRENELFDLERSKGKILSSINDLLDEVVTPRTRNSEVLLKSVLCFIKALLWIQKNNHCIGYITYRRKRQKVRGTETVFLEGSFKDSLKEPHELAERKINIKPFYFEKISRSCVEDEGREG